MQFVSSCGSIESHYEKLSYTARYGAKKSRSRKSDEGSRKSVSASESGSDDEDDIDLFSSSRSDYGEISHPSLTHYQV